MKLRSAGVTLAAILGIATLASAEAAEYLGPIDAQRTYSSGVVTQGGKTIWLAGMGGVTGPGGKKNTDFASQTRQVFETSRRR
jgi:enamine deaminase RidA (YjgF/YER057c/UK114 family)